MTAPADAALASIAMLDALREADELMKRGEYGEPLAEVLHFADDLLDIIAGYVERQDAGEAERGAFIELRDAWRLLGRRSPARVVHSDGLQLNRYHSAC